MKRLPSNHDNSPIHRETRLQRFFSLGVAAVPGLALPRVLVRGVAALKAIDHGYKIEALRREQQQLEAEQKRLELAIEKASSPAALEPVARQLGLQPIAPGQVTTRNDQQRNETHPAAIVYSSTCASPLSCHQKPRFQLAAIESPNNGAPVH